MSAYNEHSQANIPNHRNHQLNHWPMSNYGKITNLIGKGSYGRIYLTEHNYVLKVIELDITNFGVCLREIIYPRDISHPNIIKYHDIYVNVNHPEYTTSYWTEHRYLMYNSDSDDDDDDVEAVRKFNKYNDNYNEPSDEEFDNSSLELSDEEFDSDDSSPVGKNKIANDTKEKYVVMVMTRADGDLGQLLKSIDFKSNISLFKKIAYQMVQSVAYLTSQNILHRDIKPANFFYNIHQSTCYNIVLGDFGLAMGKVCTTSLYGDEEVYTAAYRPPEILLGTKNYDQNADIWALGASLYEIYHQKYFVDLSGVTLYGSYGYRLVLKKIFKKIGLLDESSSTYVQFLKFFEDDQRTIDKLVSGRKFGEVSITDNPEFNDLLSKMLNPSPELRQNIFMLQRHPFFDGIRSEIVGCYDVYPRIIKTTCDWRTKRNDRYFTYENIDTNTSRYIFNMINWAVGCYQMLHIDDQELLLIINILYRYISINKNKIMNINDQLQLICSILYLGSVFMHDGINVDVLVSITSKEHKITSSSIFNKAIEVATLLDFDLNFTTSYDYIFLHKNKYSYDILYLALKILMLLSMFPKYFLMPNASDMCLSTSLKYHGMPINDISKQNVTDIVDVLRNEFSKKKYNESREILFTKYQWHELMQLK